MFQRDTHLHMTKEYVDRYLKLQFSVAATAIENECILK